MRRLQGHGVSAWCFLGLVAFSILGCAKEDVTPQIVVSPGAAQRLSLFASHAPKPAPGAKTSEGAAEITVDRAGVFVIQNAAVALRIAPVSADNGGAIVSFAEQEGPPSELASLALSFGAGRKVRFAAPQLVRTGELAGLRFQGTVEGVPGLVVEHGYELHGDDRAVLIRTRVRNTTAQELALQGVFDVVRWAGAETFVPGHGSPGAFEAPYVGGIGARYGYAITSTTGEARGERQAGAARIDHLPPVMLAPQESTQVERVLLLAERPDSAALVAELSKASGLAVYPVQLSLPGAAEVPVGTTVTVRNTAGVAMLSFGRSADGTLQAELPEGRYLLELGSHPLLTADGRVQFAATKGDGAKGDAGKTQLTLPAKPKAPQP
jgi:hypothetical protein